MSLIESIVPHNKLLFPKNKSNTLPFSYFRMKKYWIGILLVSVVCFYSCNRNKQAAPAEEKEVYEEIIIDTIPRTSITFILGKDIYHYNQYYTLADHYYRLHPEDKTEIVVDSLTSILEVCDYLKKHPPVNDRPYGLINLVSHGNEFIDLSVLLYPKGPRASAKSLKQALQDSVFIPLETAIIDSNTLIYLHGCAVGNNQELLTNLALAFGSDSNGVMVKASRLFEYYTYLSRNKNPQSVRRYFAKAWYAFYNPDDIPTDAVFAEQFSGRYPGEEVNWLEGIERRFQSNPGEIYHFSFVVPAMWEEVYEDQSLVPVLNSGTKKREWLMNNQPFLSLLEQTQIPLDYFRFKYYKQKYRRNNEDIYALRVKAKAGVICLIRPLLSENDSLKALYVPFQPQENDTLFFGFSSNAYNKP